jgi:hypothetical protein
MIFLNYLNNSLRICLAKPLSTKGLMPFLKSEGNFKVGNAIHDEIRFERVFNQVLLP